ncbi:hypothetical protein [Dyadobacter sp. 50-39]|uniref:hypothetical protein n=1 Tax=Dyadobacter sp. 50-39 TaxID=1895756 RepID=UPI000AD7F70B|nr:hypothetical protein [Dyadobacter sp. 50-39]
MMAVQNLTSALKRYTGTQKINASIKCVAPQKRMNATKSQIVLGKGKSFLLRMNRMRKMGIRK